MNSDKGGRDAFGRALPFCDGQVVLMFHGARHPDAVFLPAAFAGVRSELLTLPSSLGVVFLLRLVVVFAVMDNPPQVRNSEQCSLLATLRDLSASCAVRKRPIAVSTLNHNFSFLC